MPWVRLPSGETVWVDEQGRQSESRPYESMSPSPERSGLGNLLSVPGTAIGNVYRGMENVAAGIDRWATVPEGERVTGPAAPPQGSSPAGLVPMQHADGTVTMEFPHEEGLPMEPSYRVPPPASLGAGPPVSEPTFTPYPEMEDVPANPAASELVKYMQGRESRVGAIFDRLMQQAEAGDPSNQHWASRLGGMLLAAASGGDIPGGAGALNEHLAGERAQRAAIQDRLMQLGLAREDLGGEVAEARFNESTGRWEAGRGNVERRHQTRLANIEGQNTRSERSADRRTQAGIAGWQAQAALDAERYSSDNDRLNSAILMQIQMGGNPEAFSSAMGVLPEGMQRRAMEGMATQGLAGIIASAGSRAHREMERLAGRTLPRPPRSLRDDPQRAARWYASNGVSLSHPEVLQAFPGLGGSPE